MRTVVLSYLTHDVDVSLETLSKHVLEEHKSQYKSPPDVAVFASIKKDIRKNDPRVYHNGRELGHFDGGRFIPSLTKNGITGDNITLFASENVSGKAAFIAFLNKIESPALEDKNANILQVEAPE